MYVDQRISHPRIFINNCRNLFRWSTSLVSSFSYSRGGLSSATCSWPRIACLKTSVYLSVSVCNSEAPSDILPQIETASYSLLLWFILRIPSMLYEYRGEQLSSQTDFFSPSLLLAILLLLGQIWLLWLGSPYLRRGPHLKPRLLQY